VAAASLSRTASPTIYQNFLHHHHELLLRKVFDHFCDPFKSSQTNFAFYAVARREFHHHQVETIVEPTNWLPFILFVFSIFLIKAVIKIMV
jgi:hypothetical protein